MTVTSRVPSLRTTATSSVPPPKSKTASALPTGIGRRRTSAEVAGRGNRLRYELRTPAVRSDRRPTGPGDGRGQQLPAARPPRRRVGQRGRWQDVRQLRPPRARRRPATTPAGRRCALRGRPAGRPARRCAVSGWARSAPGRPAPGAGRRAPRGGGPGRRADPGRQHRLAVEEQRARAAVRPAQHRHRVGRAKVDAERVLHCSSAGEGVARPRMLRGRCSRFTGTPGLSARTDAGLGLRRRGGGRPRPA